MGLLARKSEPAARGYLSGQRLGEHNERVEQNLDPWEIPLWRKHRYAKTPAGKALFHGAPDQKARQFREWLEAHAAEARGERGRRGEARAKALVAQHETKPFTPAPCAVPYRLRVKQACSKGLLGRSGSGRGVDVPCAPPWRYRTKELCHPRERAYVAPPEPHAFEGLL